MAAKKKAEKAKEPPFKERPFTRLVVQETARYGGSLEIDLHEDAIELEPGSERTISIHWPGVANLIAALTRAQEIHAGRKTAELPLFGEGPAPAATQDDDEEPDDEDDGDEDDGDE